METQPYHIPALLRASVDALNIRPSGAYVDCTLGGGGHTRAILQAIADADATADGASGRLLSFDQDSDAINRALADPALGGNQRLQLVYGNFRYIANFLRYYGAAQVDGILADLGVSFHHFDDAERGFSFRFEGPLDMRMNRDAHRSAATLLAEMSQQELTDIFRLYGELKQAPRIAAAIIKTRTEAPVDTIERLLGVSEPYISPRQQKKELAQLFQALRIAVNDEIGALRSLLVQARRVLRPGGRLAIITYHSLEDRLVKNFLRSGNLEGREEKDFFGRSLSPFRLLTSKPIVPDEAEIEANPRSRSAKLRVAEKLPDKE